VNKVEQERIRVSNGTLEPIREGIP